jgi:hypothetical protein
MRTRRPWIALLVFAGLGLTVWEGWRATMVSFLWRGNYGLLECWGGEAFFLPAVQRFASQQPAGVRPSFELCAWSEHHYAGRFPGESVESQCWLPTQEHALLLTRAGESCRIVVIDPARSNALTAVSEVLDLIGSTMDWRGDYVLVHGGHSADVALALRREGSAFRILPAFTGHDADPYFCVRGEVQFGARVNDGTPVIECFQETQDCPVCWTPLYSIETWRLIDGAYRECGTLQAKCEKGCSPSD